MLKELDKFQLCKHIYDNDIPVGSASFKKYDDECAEVKRVFIKEEYRGRGISNKLMELLEDLARKKDINT